MAEHFTCDRCHTDCSRGRQLSRSVEIDWPDIDHPGEKETVVLTFTVNRPKVDHETPDLCDDCYGHILNMVASQLDTDNAPAGQLS